MKNSSISFVFNALFFNLSFENIYIVDSQDCQDNNGRLGYFGNCYSNSCD